MENKIKELNVLIDSFNTKEKIELIKWSLEKCYNSWYDILDCKKSFARKNRN